MSPMSVFIVFCPFVLKTLIYLFIFFPDVLINTSKYEYITNKNIPKMTAVTICKVYG